VIGPLARDVVAGGPPRVGGGPWHAARALRVLATDAVVFAKCGEPERGEFQQQLARLGVPLELTARGETTGFSFSYDAHGVRTMKVDSVGEPWRPDDAAEILLRRIHWLHVAPLLRGDFDPEMLALLAAGRRVLFDGHGLVRARQRGPLALDGEFDRELLRHVAMLKLADEEARAITGGAKLETLVSLGVPEVIVTFGLEGSLVITRRLTRYVPAQSIHTDPTGAGDAFAVGYLAARAGGHAPVSAARRATALVAALLSGGRR
jgi:sugar/nucleoside kinase (ribokinase family)